MTGPLRAMGETQLGSWITNRGNRGVLVSSNCRGSESAWALAHLAEVLSLTGKVEVDHLVLQRLAKIAEKKPRLAVECLSLMVDGAKEPYEIVGWEKDARTVLSSALKGSDDQARTDAIALINRLDARGHSGFRELLDGTV